MVTSVTKSRTQKLSQKIKIVERYWHDHSLESTWGALSDGTISFLIQFLGELISPGIDTHEQGNMALCLIHQMVKSQVQ
jgi:hypothetical protein